MTDEAPKPINPIQAHPRRTVLAGVGAVGIAAALTACASSSGTTAAAAPSDSAAPASGDPATSAAPSASASAGGGGGGTALGATSEVPVGGGKIFTDHKVVVTQPKAGEFKAFSAVCTHQGCAVSSVSSGKINCPCHGSQFNIADGSVANGPATSPLPAATVAVANGQITLSS